MNARAAGRTPWWIVLGPQLVFIFDRVQEVATDDDGADGIHDAVAAGARPMMTRDEAIATLTEPGGPYELVEVDVEGQPCRWFADAPKTLRELYTDARSGAEFFVYDDERITYAQAWSRASLIAHVLTNDYGVAHGDRVGISMRNYPEWV
ncbi:MAG: AMP-binding protein, partial [Acidimicrobiia bacterium]|nr:AMP-binding protein [Acidimicrobiia bacterium]